MAFIHKQLARGRWQKLTLAEQLGNIGSEVTRMRIWQEKGDQQNFWSAGERALELIDLTLADKRRLPQLREIARLREVVTDIMTGSKEYGSLIKTIEDYCLNFALIARAEPI